MMLLRLRRCRLAKARRLRSFLAVCAVAAFVSVTVVLDAGGPEAGGLAPPSLSQVTGRARPSWAADAGGGGEELRWAREPAPPQLSKNWQATLATAAIGTTVAEKRLLWKHPSTRGFSPCLEPTSTYGPPSESRGYLQVYANGGLNQMRAGISDMVAIARIMNATLVIPELDKASFWQDTSKFSDVFDVEHFIHYLANDISIVKKLPKELTKSRKAVKQFTSGSGIEYYQGEVSRFWDDHQVIRASKTDFRLANNNLPLDIQKLRCRAFFEAIRFIPPIETLGKVLVERMRAFGPYIALHLRYEEDILAFTGCTYNLSQNKSDELAKIRTNTPQWKEKEIDPLEQREKGECPLTPKEAGILLSSLGYPSSTPIYIASGEIYDSEVSMVELRSRFSLLLDKEKLATFEELEPFRSHASQVAALDYIVSLESDVFVPTYPGHMAMAVSGHRRFLGHRRTIVPDRKGLVPLFNKLDQGLLQEGKSLFSRISRLHAKRQGSPRKRKGPVPGTRGTMRFKSEEKFYANPKPECLCQPPGIGADVLQLRTP